MYHFPHLLNPSKTKTYTTSGGMTIQREWLPLEIHYITDELPDRLNTEKGALFSSSFEYTGRYTRWDIGFINPPVEISSRGGRFKIKALNRRGTVILKSVYPPLSQHPHIEQLSFETNELIGKIQEPNTDDLMDETERTKQASVFDVIRVIQSHFYCEEDAFLGLYGAFGFDLIYQFEKIPMKKERPAEQQDLLLYLPDELFVIDRKADESYCLRYDFIFEGETTKPFPRESGSISISREKSGQRHWAYSEGQYAELVKKALPEFQNGELFEVVPSQVIYKHTESKPSEIYQRLKIQNPSPYGFMINLGNEHLIGASPEMYVRVDGRMVETCPISGTIARGQNALEDADNIRKLLNSGKDEAELTMCTDVDRNDKSRICVPGTVNVIGRRQIEMYSKLFHTVDHITGELRPEFDGIDAFITHMWAVTVTGAPKRAAVNWIEAHEPSPRGWYGGAIGWMAFNGNINTGLTLRTAKIKGEMAEMRVGATLLHASIPEEEEQETLIKVKALSLALDPAIDDQIRENRSIDPLYKDFNILLVDHEDSFVHTLGNYFKQTGAQVKILRANQARVLLSKKEEFDLVVLSPGPSTPDQFKMRQTIQLCLEQEIPLFGICLGFQGIAEYFGGELGVLPNPSHGVRKNINIYKSSPFFDGFSTNRIDAGLYHSLFVKTMPQCLELMAATSDGVSMAFRHRELPIYGVQFHPESI
ncbi:MAG: anthranilate synthase component I, partial [Tuberibacillus sp.]